MRLEPGASFGRFTIEEVLGEGGMGVVYRAYDTKLERRVALKLLRLEGTLAGAEREKGAARMLREARAASAIEHVNAVLILDVGDVEDVPYIAMELVSGRALRSYVGDRSVDQATAVGWLADVAEALHAAHTRGLVHRDVKPENVMVRVDGTVKVLDFGIAVRAGQGLAGNGTEAPPAFRRDEPWRTTLSREGSFVGTPRYMAPEQLRGEDIDARTDQFAWGVMAFELISGVPPWDGDRVTLSALADDAARAPVALRVLVPTVSESLERIVLRAMAPRREDRFPSMAPIVEALRGELAGSTSRRGGWFVAVGAASALSIALAVSMLVLRRHGAEPASAGPATSAAASSGFAFHPTHIRRVTFGEDCEEFPSFTPDGARIVFDTARGADSVIAVITLRDGTERPITDVHGWDYAAGVSPDGRRVAFLREADGRVGTWVTDIDGAAPPRFIADGRMRPGFSRDGAGVWAGDPEHPTLFDVESRAPLRVLNAPRGVEAPLARELQDGRVLFEFPNGNRGTISGLAEFSRDGVLRWLVHEPLEEVLAVTPDQRYAIVSRQTEANNTELLSVPLAGGTPSTFVSSDVSAWKGMSFARDGRMVAWSTCRSLVAPTRMDGSGKLVPLHERVGWQEGAVAPIAGSRGLVVVSERAGAMAAWVVDQDGKAAPRQLTSPTDHPPIRVAVSPDGTEAVLELTGAGLFLAPLDGTPGRALTDASTDSKPTFRRDGRDVLFTRAREGAPPQVYAIDSTGGEPRPYLDPGTSDAAPSPLDDRVAYLAGPDEQHAIPMIANMATGIRLRASAALGEGRYRSLAISPDGTRLAMLIGTAGILEVDLKTGVVTRRADAGSAGLASLTYLGADPVVARTQWLGDVWIADGPF